MTESKEKHVRRFYDFLAETLESVPPELTRWILPTMVLLGAGKPLSEEQIIGEHGISSEEGKAFWEWLGTGGFGELDTQGRLAGLGGISVTPTRHSLKIGERTLFGWCALDTLFLPWYLDEAAEVASTCPVTGLPVRLRVTPAGVEKAEPDNLYMSLVGPGFGLEEVGCHTRKGLVGTAGSLCGQIFFLASKEAAAAWHSENPEAEILTLAEADALAHRQGRVQEILFASRKPEKSAQGE